jgi:hypothetical protein
MVILMRQAYVDPIGPSVQSFQTTGAGSRELLKWLEDFGTVELPTPSFDSTILH